MNQFAFRLAFFLTAVLAQAEGALPPKGDYFGTLMSHRYSDGGYVRLVLNAAGRGTLSVQMGKSPKGVFNVSLGESGTVVLWAKKSPYRFDQLALTEGWGGPFFEGIVSLDDMPASFRAILRVPPPEARLLAGSYTALFSNEQADVSLATGTAGWASMRVTTAGAVRLSGRLADGALISQGGMINSEGRFPIYSMLPGYRRVSGVLSFDAGEDFDLSADEIYWQKGEVAQRGVVTQEAQSAILHVRGSRYDPSRMLDLASGFGEFRFHVRDGVSSLINAGVRRTTSGQPLLTPDVRAIAALRVWRSTGVITGRYRHPEDARWRSLTGVVFQKTGAAGGLAITPDRNGEFAVVSSLGSIFGSSVSSGAGTLTGGSVYGGSVELVRGSVLGGSVSGGVRTESANAILAGGATGGDVTKLNAAGSTGILGSSGIPITISNPANVAYETWTRFSDEALITLGSSTDLSSLTGAQLKADIAAARAGGESSYSRSGVTFTW